MRKIRWGILSTAAIARNVVPALNGGRFGIVTAIASRELSKAQSAADALGINNAYGTYKELLEDPDVDAIYNPLPNHLHVPWTIKAATAGKHVLCEKPLSMTAAGANEVLRASQRTHVKVGEAFTFRCHPQWLRALELIRGGQIGEVRSMSGSFNYFNDDPSDIRNRLDCGGGALADVGCYLINASRFIFEQEPTAVVASMDRDPHLGTDYLASALLTFPKGQASISCSTQSAADQRITLHGTRGKIEIGMPFNAPPERPATILIAEEGDFFGDNAFLESFPACNQHTLQGDAFAEAILNDTPVPVSVEDAIKNATVMESILRSASLGQWVGV